MSTTPQQIYEQTLVVRSQIGDEAAFQELLGLYGPRLFSFARRMTGSTEHAEDLTQEIWVAIYRGLPSLLDTGKFRPWAFRIARDRIYRDFRRRKLPVRSFEEIELEDLEETGQPDPTIDLEELHLCLGTLSPEHRETLVLRYFEDMDYEEIARVTGNTLGTVRSRIHYAKRALRRALKEKCYESQ